MFRGVYFADDRFVSYGNSKPRNNGGFKRARYGCNDGPDCLPCGLPLRLAADADLNVWNVNIYVRRCKLRASLPAGCKGIYYYVAKLVILRACSLNVDPAVYCGGYFRACAQDPV